MRVATPIARATGAGAVYFAIVFAWAFALGVVRVLVVAPRVGEVAAVLVEAPLVLAASWLACRWTVRRLGVGPAVGERLIMGALAFLLLMIAEFALSLLAFGRPARAWLEGFATPAGAIGLAAQIAFGFVPLLQRAAPRP
ncbi:hypothetical protein [Phenylobacterium sp.]|uniref:hypothetical protein n=1 Tax=Phenylobacterium sp. TaxID=1871053 RepID=UPI00286B524C|nr:hypothetical protein [Phenylobacterium sp.]